MNPPGSIRLLGSYGSVPSRSPKLHQIYQISVRSPPFPEYMVARSGQGDSPRAGMVTLESSACEADRGGCGGGEQERAVRPVGLPQESVIISRW